MPVNQLRAEVEPDLAKPSVVVSMNLNTIFFPADFWSVSSRFLSNGRMQIDSEEDGAGRFATRSEKDGHPY